MHPHDTAPPAPRAATPLSHKRVALGSAAIVALAIVGVPVVNAVASAGAGTKVLTNIVPGLAKLTDLGQVADTKPMLIGISIPGNTAARDAAYKAMTTKGSASYGYQYTPASFAAAFGVSAGVSSSVQTWAAAEGLKPVYTAKDGSYVELTGSAAQVEKTLKVSVHNYQVKGKTYYASTTGATVPTAAGTVLGLSDFDTMHIHDSQGVCAAAACTGVLTPPALWGAYDEPDTYKEGDALKSTDNYGQGQKVAIFGEGDLKQVVTDLRNFEDDTTEIGDTQFLTTIAKPALPHIPVEENLVNDDQSDVSGLGEWDLDSQASTGMSPDLEQLQFYFGQDLSDAAIAGIYSDWVNDAEGAMIGNSSFGGCELLEGALGDEAADDALFQQAVMMGRSMFVSTGDTGSGGCVVDGAGLNGITQGAPSVEYPSASPYVVAVGGTVIYTAGTTTQTQPVTRGVEYAWTYTGGGSADFEPQPADQTNLGAGSPNIQPCIGDASGTPATDGAICRAVPDVDAMSGDVATNGYAIETASTAGKPGSGMSETGGTSLSSPLWAGMWARVRAAHTAKSCTAPVAVTAAGLATVAESTKSDIGFAQQALYDVALASTADDDAAFFDIGGTTNSQPGTTLPAGNGMYTALPRTPLDPTGYDLVSGLGTPDLSKIALILDCTTAPAKPLDVPNSSTVTIITPSGSNCPPNGTATDATGDESPTDTALDLVSVHDTSDSSGITFTTTVAGLPETSATQENLYDAFFTYGGTVYYVEADDGGTGGGGTPTYSLYQQGTMTNTTLSSTLTGSFDNTAGTVTVNLPYATFNSTAKPSTALAAGATLTTLTFDSSTTTALLNDADTGTFGTCNFVLAGDVTTPSPSPSVTPSSSSPSPSVTPSSSSPSPSVTPSSSSPSPSPSTTPSSASPSPSVTTSSASPTTSPVAVQSLSITPPTRFHPLSYKTLGARTVVNGHDEATRVVGVAGVPSTDVVDVLLQVTVDKATANAPVLIDSAFGSVPAQQAAVSAKGKTVRNVVLVTPDSLGSTHIEVTQGSTRIALAVVGYDSRGAGDGFNPTFGGRVSSTVTPVTTSKKALNVVIGGKGGVPSSSLDATLLDARVSGVSLPKKVASATLYATVAGGSAKTAIATIYPGVTTTSLLVARPNASGKVTFSLSAGSAKIVVNEYGTWADTSYTAAHVSTSALRYGHAMAAKQEFLGSLGTGTKTITLAGLPAGASSAILQVSVAAGKQAGEVQLTPSGTRFGDGTVSYLPNLGSGQLVAVAPDALGRVSLRLTKGTRIVGVSLVGFTAFN